jgi:hypothetical protein
VRERTRKHGSGAAAFVVFALLLVALQSLARAGTSSHPVNIDWNTQALIKITLTPNYTSGFGQVPAVIGTQPAPTHGPNATLGGGSIDFGSVEAGKNYLYKYAAHLNVVSNAATGVNVYGEGAADFSLDSGGGSIPIADTLYYLTSTSGSPADPNTGFSPSVAFQKTGGVVSGGTYTSSSASISYCNPGCVYPSPIATSSTEDADFYWDYQLKVPATAATGDYFVWIVYTVVAK